MKRKSKDILFVCQFFYPEYISSATLPFDTAQYLSEKGYKVGVLCGYPKEYSTENSVPEREKIHGIDIHRINYIQMDRKRIVGRIVNYFSLVFAMLLHIGEMKDYKTIILYSNPPLLPIIAMICKKLYKNKIVFVSYDVYPEIATKTNTIGEDGLTARFFRKMNVHFFRNVDKIVALSEDMKQFLVECRNVGEDKIDVIPNWYEDCAEKEIVSSEVLEKIPNNAFVLSYLGNLGTCQDGDILVELAKTLQQDEEVFFVIAGHGNKMDALNERVEREGLCNMKVLPFLHGADYEAVLARSDMFIVTLQPGLAGLCAPSKTYAYLMSGKPVLAAMDKEMEIAKDIVQYNAGIVLEKNNCEETGEIISSLKDDKSKLTLIGQNARKLFLDKYEKNTCLEKYQHLFIQLLEGESLFDRDK